MDMVTESWNLIHSWGFEGSEAILEASRSGKVLGNIGYVDA